MRFAPIHRRAGAALHRRTGPGPARVANHRRAGDRFERQADDAAARVVAGRDHQAARVLTAAPAAAAAVPGSPGAPLPAATRAVLEDRFGADLAAVRVHTDAAAGAAATDLAARAFTAGRDVYLGPGVGLDGAAGLHLLAHEVAHVLQQTGVPGPDGRLHATARTGAGLVQRAPGKPLPAPPTARPTLDLNLGDNGVLDLAVTEITGGFSTDPDLATAIDWFYDRLKALDGTIYRRGASKGSTQALDALAAEIKKGVDGGSGAARSFVVEILALTDGGPSQAWWKAAATVLDRDSAHEIRTRLSNGSLPFVKWLRTNRDDDYFAKGLTHPRIKPWFDDLVPAYLEPLIDPRITATRELTGTDQETGTTQGWPAQQALLVSELTQLTANERMVHAINLLTAINNERSKFQLEQSAAATAEAAKRKEAKQPWDSMESRVVMARTMSTQFAEDKYGKRPAVWKDLATKLRQAATQVETFYLVGLALRNRYLDVLKNDASVLMDPATADLDAKLASTPELVALGVTLETHAAVLFENPATAPPAPLVYSGRLTAFQNELTRTLHKLVAALVSELTLHPDTALSPTRAWIILWIRQMNGFLTGAGQYDPSADLKDTAQVATATGTATVQHEDVRRGHRRALAHALLATARFANFPKVVTVTTAMIEADKKSRILILAPWQLDDAPVSQLATDFPGQGEKPIDWTSASGVSAKAPFTIRHLITFAQLQYLDTLNTGIEAVLDSTYQGTIDAKTRFDLKPASDAAKAMPRPRRWVAPKTALHLAPEDPQNLRSLLIASDKTSHQLARDRLGARIFPNGQVPQVFAWVVPDLTPLVQFIRRSLPGLDAAITSLTGQPAPADADEWVAQVGLLTSPTASNGLAAIILELAIGNALDSTAVGLPAQRTRLLRNSRHVVALDRRIVALRARDLLDRWAKRSRGGATVDSVAADNALRLIVEFRFRVEPIGDTDAQTAALVLDLAGKLDEVFTNGKDIPPSLLPLLDLGIAAAKAQAAGRTAPTDVLLADVLGRGETTATLTAGQAQLESVRQRLTEFIASQQVNHGFRSSGDHLKSFLYAASFGPKDEFTQDGRHFRIRRVHQAFAYHPPWSGLPSTLKDGDGPAAKDLPRDQAIPLFTIDIDDSAAPLVSSYNSVGIMAGPAGYPAIAERAARRKLPPLPETATAEEQDERAALEEQLAEEAATERDTGRYIVTSADDGMLQVIAHAVEMGAMVAGLERTAAISQGLMEVMVTAAELYLPGGQAIAWAELAGSAYSIARSDEVQELVESLSKDPALIIGLIQERLTNLVTPEAFWDVIFDDGAGSVLTKFKGFTTINDEVKTKHKTKAKSASAAPRGRLGRIVRFFGNLGRRFLRAFSLLKLKFRRPIAALRASIITRPKLAWMLDKALDLLAKVQRMVGMVGMTPTELFETGLEAKDRVIGLAQAVSDVELPGELVPLEDLYAMVIDFILGKIPKVKLIRPILDQVGWTNKLAGLIIDEIGAKDSWADPNKYWREFLRDAIEPHFLKLKRELVDSMLDLINQVGRKIDPTFAIALPGDGELGDSKPQLVAADELEASPSEQPALPATMDLPRDAGAPLATEARTSAESIFSQDFGHVRVHNDAPAALYTATLGAEAVTSGSHVFLGDIGPGHATEVLHHELAHVVQQTGDRRLGDDHSTTPVRGDAGKGVTYDPAREAAADRMADAAGRGAAAPLGQPADPIGAQPKLSEEVLRKVIRSVTTFRPGGGQFKAPVAGGAVPDGPRAAKVWTDFKKVIDTSKANFPTFLSSTTVKPVIIDRLTSTVTNDDIQGVASLAQRKKAGAVPDASGVTPTELNPNYFITLLEGFLYARTGVALQIQASHSKGATTVDKIAVTYLHLPFLPYQGKAQALWDKVMATPGLIKATDTDPQIKLKMRRLLKARLEALAPDPFLWHVSKPDFELSARFVKEFRHEYDESLKRGRPTAIDEADTYADPKSAKFSGLKVATHGELTGGSPAGRDDRESHHVPQFLVAEFFRNRNAGVKAWPDSPRSYDTTGGTKPILDLQGTKPLIDQVIAGGKTFQLKLLDPNSARGEGLPAVLLAAETHQRGPLHLDDLPPDEKADTQGETIRDKWHSLLPPQLQNTTDSKWAAYLKATPAAGKVLAKAMVETYRWVYQDVMVPGLRHALNKQERAYYEGLAAELGHVDASGKLDPKYTFGTKHTNRVVTAVEALNTTTMTDWK